MPLKIAWRILAHQKGRTALAIGGIFIAILLIFVELGFFIAVPQGGMLIYDHMRFDLLVVSKKYVFQTESWQFPRARLEEARKNPDVAEAGAVYLGGAKWQDSAGGVRLDISVIGFAPRARPFMAPDIDRQITTLEKPDTVLVDSQTRSIFGPLTPGRVVELNGRPTTIGGTYELGTGFLGLGIVLAEAVFVMVVAFVPAFAAALGLYAVIRAQTLLPVIMSPTELAGVFAITMAMSVISAVLSVGRLRRADPAEVF